MLGRSGTRALKREGDGASPAGRWRLVEVRFRADRGRRPATPLAATPISAADGWCDAPADRNYNREVQHPYPASAERLWRDDEVYDVLVVLDHNLSPRVRGHGSAVFIHIARDDLAPTAGCVAMRRGHLERLLGAARRTTRIMIGTLPPRPVRRA